METTLDQITINGKQYIPAGSVPAVKERKGAWVIGEQYLIRTVTMMQTGRLVYIDNHELVLEDAAWIADSGRFSDALKNGSFNEVEPFDSEVIIGRAAIVDAAPYKNKLPRSQK
jgi:hypothetical protein